MTTTVQVSDRHPNDIKRATAALWAGIGYVFIFVLAIAANFGVVQRVIIPGNPEATVAAIANGAGAFRFGVVAFGAIFVIDVVVAWALHVLLRSMGERRSLLAAWMRLTYTMLLGVGVGFLHLAGQIATGAAQGIDEAARAGLTVLMLDAFDITWLVGLIAFGAHLALVGAILSRARIAPQILCAGLVVAGAAYVVDTAAHLALADYASVASVMLVVVAVPSILAELGLTVWLFVTARRLRVP